MTYITYSEFLALYPNTTLSDDDEFAVLNKFASLMIDRVTMNKIEIFGGVSEFSSFTQERIREATAAQINTFVAQGYDDAVNGFATSNTGGFKIGRYSETGSSRGDKSSMIEMIDSVPLSPLVNAFLQPTNLLNRALNRCYRLSDFR